MEKFRPIVEVDDDEEYAFDHDVPTIVPIANLLDIDDNSKSLSSLMPNQSPISSGGGCKTIKAIANADDEHYHNLTETKKSHTNILTDLKQYFDAKTCASLSASTTTKTSTGADNISTINLVMNADQPDQDSIQDSEMDAKLESKSKSVNQLNPIGPNEFIDRYRVRNSSQRPLMTESFSSSINNAGSNGGHNLENDFSSTSNIADSNLNVDENSNLDLNPKDVNENTDSESMPERGQWSGKLDFIFSCISYAVGLGNVWRFPYLCYQNGGGAFLIPYLICVCLLGIPLFLMEVSLGQYLQSGGVAIWNKIPILKGIGFASMVMIGLCNTYYIVIISWTLYYLFNSVRSPLPWSNCGNDWNTDACHEKDSTHNITTGSVTPAQEYWNLNVLNISDDLADVGSIQWHLFGTLIVAWILVYLVIYRGLHQSGKIIWFTAMFPYVILVILFGYGLTLSGAQNGIRFYLTPDWEKLKNAEIWVAAGTQLLFTYGIGIGTNIALGSYNTFNHNFLRDSMIACLLSSGTSLFSGFVIFSVIGHLAETMNSTVAEVAVSGPGLTFIVYPEAIVRLPVPNLWAILFFIMLLVLGIDSQFCTVESFITGIVDEWPRFLRPRRQLFTAFVVLIHFLLGITMITSGGMYMFQLMDNFAASGISLMVVVLMEIVGFCWIYGAENIYHNTCKMLGYKPPRLLYYCWVYISPAFLLAILIFSIVQYVPPSYANRPFPWYGILIGWIISSASIICIPLYVLYYLFFKSDSNLSLVQRFINGLSEFPKTRESSSSRIEELSSSNESVDLEKSDINQLPFSSSINGKTNEHYHHAHHLGGAIPIASKHGKGLPFGGSCSALSTTLADQACSINSKTMPTKPH